MENIINRDYHKISAWLLVGVIMVFVQIILGGITRLTGSGLSITRWEIVTGILPPLSTVKWQESFDLYKQTPQYQQINEGISLAYYKFIFFWEYTHRLWARLMGFVFVLPFFYFLLRRSLGNKLIRRLGVVVLLAGLAAIFGWIMVASGLIEKPWVNAYKLTIHLGLGISLFIYLFITWLSYRGYKRYPLNMKWQRAMRLVLLIVILQIAFGGLLSGMKAALNFPTWPLMNGRFIPEILIDSSHWNADNFLLYDRSGFMAALVQFMHRNLAYLITIMIAGLAIYWNQRVSAEWKWISIVLIGIIVVQVTLGILTLLNSKGAIPLLYGVLHQGVGILFLTFLIYVYVVSKTKKV